MTARIIKLGGTTNWTASEVLKSADLIDTFNKTKKEFISSYGPVDDTLSLIPHGGTILSHIDGGVAIQNTTDYQSNNITWTSKNTNVDAQTGTLGVHCKDDKTRAVALVMSTNEDGAYTTNSGVTWGDSSTNPPNQDTIVDISYPTSSLALAGGTAASGVHMWRTTDGGDNWAQVAAVAGGGGGIQCVDMLDGTSGFALDDSTNILITGDGGDNWTDTGQTAVSSSVIYAINATTYLLAAGNVIYKGTSSSAPVRVLTLHSSYTTPTHFIKTNSGNIYIAFITTTAVTRSIILAKSTDSGVTWTSEIIGTGFLDTTTHTVNGAVSKGSLAEAANDILLLAMDTGNAISGFYEIDERDS